MGVSYESVKAPAEDFARATVTLLDSETGQPLIIECTSSWCYVGSGLRIQVELQGPEYSMSVNTQDTELRLFFSDAAGTGSTQIGGGGAGEEAIEKANASTGLIPTVPSEPAAYGYIAENQEFVSAFRSGRMPSETWKDGLEVVRLLMGMYLSAEEERTVRGDELHGEGVRNYVPRCASVMAT